MDDYDDDHAADVPVNPPATRGSPADAETQLPTRDKRAHDLVPQVYDQLRKLANMLLHRMSPGETIQATALVNEAYVRLLKKGDPGWANQPHVKGAFVIAMRRELLDRARKRDRRIKTVAFDPELIGLSIQDAAEDLLQVDAALEAMEATPGLERQAEVVLLKFYGDMTIRQIADLLETSLRTVERDWEFARRWLRSRLDPDG